MQLLISKVFSQRLCLIKKTHAHATDNTTSLAINLPVAPEKKKEGTESTLGKDKDSSNSGEGKKASSADEPEGKKPTPKSGFAKSTFPLFPHKKLFRR